VLGVALHGRAKVRRHGAVKTHIVLKLTDAAVTARELDRHILDLVADPEAGDAAFDRVAVEVFRYQYAANAPYRALCDRVGRTPQTVSGWRDIPAISAASFGDARLACFSPQRARLRFVSSGTTRGGGRASVHEMDTTALYDASLERQFRRCVMPDRDRMRMLFLVPAFSEAPESSLAYMCFRLFERCATSGGFYVRSGRLEGAALSAALRASEEPTLVFGTALAFVHFLDGCRDEGARFALPAGSRLIETGGFKGRSRSVEPQRFYEAISQTFGVPLELCGSEYGMCELSSQWYDAQLSDGLAGRPLRSWVKVGPPWTRFLVVDPVTMEPVADGREGLLSVFDPCNRGSVAAVLTADVVRRQADGFLYLGRSPAAPPKGCSISADAMLESHA